MKRVLCGACGTKMYIIYDLDKYDCSSKYCPQCGCSINTELFKIIKIVMEAIDG